MKTQIHKLNKKNSLLHGVMVFIMLVPLIVGAVFSAQDSNSVKAAATDAPSKVNLVVTKYLFGDGDYEPYDIVDNGGKLNAAESDGIQKQGNVPFRLYQMNISSNATADNAGWMALAHFFGDSRTAGEYVGGHYIGSKNAAGGGVDASGSVTAADWSYKTNNLPFAQILNMAYETALGKPKADELIPDVNNGNGAKYPDTEAQFNAVAENLMQFAVTMGMFTVKAGLTSNDAPKGVLQFNNIDNEKNSEQGQYARYVLIESTTVTGKTGNAENGGGLYDTETHKNNRHTALPMVLNLPIEDSWEVNSNPQNGEAENNMYIYPKNEIPLQNAEFRKVDMSKPAATEDSVISGASYKVGENIGLEGVKFALFRFKYTGNGGKEVENSLWEQFKNETTMVAEKADQSGYSFTNTPSTSLEFELLKHDYDEDDNPMGLYTSGEDGQVLSDKQTYGKYFFMEVESVPGFSISNYPITFEITPDNVDGVNNEDNPSDERHPAHAVSKAANLDETMLDGSEWQVPNYEIPTLDKSLEVFSVDGTNTAYPVGDDGEDSHGFEHRNDSKYRYSLSADIKNPQTLMGDFLAFYDIFTTNKPEKNEDGDYDYPLIGDDDLRSLFNIKDVFDIAEGETKVKDFYDTPEEGVYDGASFSDGKNGSKPTWNVTTGQADIETTRITSGVDSSITLQIGENENGVKQYYYFTDNNGSYKHKNDNNYHYVGEFTKTDGSDEHPGIASTGWYDAVGENGAVDTNTWAENGTPQGTHIYWSINTTKMLHQLAAQIYHSGVNLDDETNELANAFAADQVKLLRNIKSLDLDFILTPLRDGNGQSQLTKKQLQALHNIGQFEWNSTTEHPWVEAENNAYVGGRTFRKQDQNGQPLQTNGGHFYIQRKVNGETSFLKYDKDAKEIIGWVDTKEQATKFDTSAVGEDEEENPTGGIFTVFGLVPNSEDGEEVSTFYSNGEEIEYRIFESSTTLTIGEGADAKEYRPESQTQFEEGTPFLVMPHEPTVDDGLDHSEAAEGEDESDGPETQADDAELPVLTLNPSAVDTTHITNMLNADLPITGGIGMLVFIVLGLGIVYVGYRYFKKRRSEMNN